MQKARRPPSRVRPLVDVWFQVLFTPLLGVLFTFPLQYWFTIGLSVVFSLGEWSPHIQTGFRGSRPTFFTIIFMTLTRLSLSLVWLSRPLRL
jgi:hypothetical protein